MSFSCKHIQVLIRMKVVVLVLITLIIFQSSQNRVSANDVQKPAFDAKSAQQGNSGTDSQIVLKGVLVDQPANDNRNKALLAMDKEGRPAIYPLVEEERRCVMLNQHFKEDILAHWTPTSEKNGIYSFAFFYWLNTAWRPATVELQFRDNKCSRFRVLAEDIKIQRWLNPDSIPAVVNRHSDDGKLILPFAIGFVEGPRDRYVCGTHPISEKFSKLLEEGRCPLGLQ
jgi:hypothetical protein